ncbi:hypothetical protein AB0E01_42445 [Nocardia vinacea]|uniref:WXG100-like domain-containing protein n=1 Tax=Nocardia vinacea TaxID=96468 RepID=UPI0033F4AAF2
MSIEIPSDVALFLNYCGVPYPDINEDDVRALAEHVRVFATGVQETHESATGTVKQMGSVYSGYSYEQLVAAWAAMSATHMADLDRACRFVATALDIAAEVIVGVKVAVLAELAALAASYAAAMGASIATSGLSATAGPAIAAAAKRLCSAMEQALVSYVLAEVMGKALEPLEDAVDRLINGTVHDAVRDALGVAPASPSSSIPLHIEPDEVLRYADILDSHADDILKHAETFANNVATLDFMTPPSHHGVINDYREPTNNPPEPRWKETHADTPPSVGNTLNNSTPIPEPARAHDAFGTRTDSPSVRDRSFEPARDTSPPVNSAPDSANTGRSSETEGLASRLGSSREPARVDAGQYSNSPGTSNIPDSHASQASAAMVTSGHGHTERASLLTESGGLHKQAASLESRAPDLSTHHPTTEDAISSPSPSPSPSSPLPDTTRFDAAPRITPWTGSSSNAASETPANTPARAQQLQRPPTAESATRSPNPKTTSSTPWSKLQGRKARPKVVAPTTSGPIPRVTIDSPEPNSDLKRPTVREPSRER